MKDKNKVINTFQNANYVLMGTKINIMNYKLLFLLFFNGLLYSQNLHHQMFSAQGKSIELSNGMLVSQTIGQQSAIGNYKNTYTVGQGFQQSNWGKLAKAKDVSKISTITYPNPFISTINFQFSQAITEKIMIVVFDVRGRLVYQQKLMATGNILTIELPQLPAGSYLVLLKASNYTYYSKILKKQ
jgi:hypothetical protein